MTKKDALVRRADSGLAPSASEPPPMILARSLEEAPPRAFVHVDNRGRVRSPARYRALQAASYGAAGALALLATTVYGGLFGLPGVGVGIGISAYLAWQIRRGRRLERAARLIAHDRLDEAEALLVAILRSWRCPKAVRALAEQNLGQLHMRRGEFDQALQHQRVAMTWYARTRSKSIFARTVEYSEIATLVSLGRVGEARQRLEQRGAVPAGDYLRLQHWTAELYVCLGEGEHRLSAEELHDRAHVALGITGAWVLLGLLAWAHAARADFDQAWHLLREAYDRRSHFPVEKSMPLLDEWIRAHATEAGVETAAS